MDSRVNHVHGFFTHQITRAYGFAEGREAVFVPLKSVGTYMVTLYELCYFVKQINVV